MDHVLDIEDGISRVHGRLVLGRFTNEPFLVREGDEGGRGEASLLIGDCEARVRNDFRTIHLEGHALISTPAPS